MSINLLLKRLLVLFVITNSYAQTQLSGKIENATSPHLILKDNFYKTIDTININKTTGEFSYKSNLLSGYYFLNYQKKDIHCYLTKGKNLIIFFDTENIYRSLKFQGNIVDENNYLAKKHRLLENIPSNKTSYFSYARLNEKSFLKLTDSVFNLFDDLFLKEKELPSDFKELEKISIKIDYAIQLATYQTFKRIVDENPNFKTSNNYPNPFSIVNVNNPKYLRTYHYNNYVNEFINKNVSKLENPKLNDPISNYFKALKKSSLHHSITDQLAMEITEVGFGYIKNLENFRKTFISLVKTPKHLETFEKLYQRKVGKVGKPSANFKFQDINEKTYSLEDFRGKYVYIDLWASWCSGCLLQIPYLKKLKNEFNDKITFVGISYKDKKESWKQALNKNKLKGVQLFSTDENDDFFKFYNVQSLPRFILLDKQGNVLNSNAKAPSDKSIRELFKKLD